MLRKNKRLGLVKDEDISKIKFVITKVQDIMKLKIWMKIHHENLVYFKIKLANEFKQSFEIFVVKKQLLNQVQIKLDEAI